jgi:hypothetical protein
VTLASAADRRSRREPTQTATIRAIGFFDFFHNQTGVAPNEIELHPVLRFMDATCEVVS